MLEHSMSVELLPLMTFRKQPSENTEFDEHEHATCSDFRILIQLLLLYNYAQYFT